MRSRSEPVNTRCGPRAVRCLALRRHVETVLYSIYASFAVLTGTVMGSFANVLVARLPRDASLVVPSHCPRCGATVRWRDLIPVVSWVILRGKCRECNAPIAPTYPLVEVVGGLLGYLLFKRFFIDFSALTIPNAVAFLLFGAATVALITALLVDIRHQIIPDQTSIWMVPIGLLGMYAIDQLGVEAFPIVPWQWSVLGALLGGGFLAVVAFGFRITTGKVGMGMGDAKLMAMIGAFTGALPGVWVILILSCILGIILHLMLLIARQKRGYAPFAPSLVLSTLTYILYGDVLTPLFLPNIWDMRSTLDGVIGL